MTSLAHYFPVPATGTGETMKIRNSFGNTFSGTLGKSITAAKNKNVNYAREYVIPETPRSGLQQEHRNAFHAGKEVWNGLRRSQQAFYLGLARADPRAVSGYNIFLERYLFAVKVGEVPEIATVLRWRRETAEPRPDLVLDVLKDEQPHFSFPLKAAEGELALTRSDVPYRFFVRRGKVTLFCWTMETLDESTLPAPFEAEGVRIRLERA